MNNTPSSTIEVIEALGGTKQVALITGRKTSAASMWRKFETFPSNTYLVMKSALEALGLQADPALWGMTQPQETTE